MTISSLNVSIGKKLDMIKFTHLNGIGYKTITNNHSIAQQYKPQSTSSDGGSSELYA